MKHLILGFVLLFLASVSTAQAQTDVDKLNMQLLKQKEMIA